MKWPNEPSAFMVLPQVETNQQKMSRKRPTLKLFTKTWPPKRQDDDENEKDRPLTATLEKPQILDIKFLGKIDMSLIRKEFLSLTNLCRAPLVIGKVPKVSLISSRRRNNVTNRPLSLPSTDNRFLSVTRRSRRVETSDDSWEDEESCVSSQAQSARSVQMSKLNPKRIPTSTAMTGKRQPVKKLDPKLANDQNNNQKLAKIVQKRSDNNNTTTETADKKPNVLRSSTKLPEPCTTCGRPDQPERFHSHPVTPLKPSARKLEDSVKIPVKSSVQKPIAIKYKSKQSEMRPAALKPAIPMQKVLRSPPPGGQVQSERPKTGTGPRTLMCYLCGREFGTASLPLHEPKCLEKWRRENASLPPNQRRQPPKKPEKPMTAGEWNEYAWEACQASLMPCENCGRTFLPDRLVVHQRSCKPQHGVVSNKSIKNLSSRKSY